MDILPSYAIIDKTQSGGSWYIYLPVTGLPVWSQTAKVIIGPLCDTEMPIETIREQERIPSLVASGGPYRQPPPRKGVPPLLEDVHAE